MSLARAVTRPHISHVAKITRITTQTRHPDRVSVFLDGEFAFGLSKTQAAELNLTEGRELSDAEVEALRGDVDDARVYDRLLRLLAIRAHSRAELKRKLVARRFDREAVARALARAEEAGYLDDTQFALDFARQGRDLKGWAPARTRLELRRRGVAAPAIEQALADIYGDIDLLEQAIALAAARVRRLSGDRESVRRRLVGFLTRRGYPTAICRKATDAVAP